MEQIKVSTKFLAEHFEVSEKYVSQLVIDHQMPKIGHNTFDFIVCSKWWWKYREKVHRDEIRKLRERVSSRERLENAQAELKEMEVLRMKNELVPIDPVRMAMRNLTEIYVKALEALKTRLAPELIHAKTEQEIIKSIQKETDKIREQIASLPADISAESVEFASSFE